MWTSRALMVGVHATVVLAATSLAGIAGESGKFIGAHEVPPFVCERVELVFREVNPDPGSAVCARES